MMDTVRIRRNKRNYMMMTKNCETKLPQKKTPARSIPRRCRQARFVPFVLALFLASLSARHGWSTTDGPSPDAITATPTLVQHVATGMDRYPINTLTIQLPNPARAGNCMILGVQF